MKSPAAVVPFTKKKKWFCYFICSIEVTFLLPRGAEQTFVSDGDFTADNIFGSKNFKIICNKGPIINYDHLSKSAC